MAGVMKITSYLNNYNSGHFKICNSYQLSHNHRSHHRDIHGDVVQRLLSVSLYSDSPMASPMACPYMVPFTLSTTSSLEREDQELQYTVVGSIDSAGPSFKRSDGTDETS